MKTQMILPVKQVSLCWSFYYDGGTDTLYQLKFDIDTPDTATVTANAAVGGTIVGTFAGTVEHNGRELEITNGVFRVKRADIMF